MTAKSEAFRSLLAEAEHMTADATAEVDAIFKAGAEKPLSPEEMKALNENINARIAEGQARRQRPAE